MNNQDHFCIIKFQMADNVGIALSDLQAGHAYPLYTCQGEYLGDLRIAEAQPPWSLAPSGPAVPRYHKVATEEDTGTLLTYSFEVGRREIFLKP